LIGIRLQIAILAGIVAGFNCWNPEFRSHCGGIVFDGVNRPADCGNVLGPRREHEIDVVHQRFGHFDAAMQRLSRATLTSLTPFTANNSLT